MSAGTSASLRWLLLFAALLDCVSAVFSHSDEQVTAETGDNVALPCGATKRNNIRVVKWIRPDLKEEGYVLFYRSDQFNTELQLPSFKGRVELKEGWKEDGDVSLILKNVTTADSGTYECKVRQEGTETELIRNISLSVGLPGHREGHKEGGDKGGGDEERSSGGRVGLVVGSVVGLVVAVVAVVFMIYKRCQMRSSPPHHESVKHQLV